MQRAADLGDAGAQYHIGMKHHRASLDGLPEAAPESRIQAYKWLQLAAAQGYRGSEAAWAFVALGMTREDVADGRPPRRCVCSGPNESSGRLRRARFPLQTLDSGRHWAMTRRS